MAQGAIKVKKSTAAAPRGGKGSAGPKKGARVIKPKKQVLVRGREMMKKHSAGLTAMTERTLGAKAGHLELLKGGKKNKDTKGAGAEVKKGGSKKFG